MINNVVLGGRLTKDPDLKYTQNGTAIASFTLAVERDFSGQDGNKETDFINCVIWRKSAETLANYVRKGQQIGVVGRIQTRNYENQQGQQVYVTEVVAERFYFLEKKDSGSNTGSNNSNQQKNNSDNKMPDFDRDSDPFAGSSIDIGDDDLPF